MKKTATFCNETMNGITFLAVLLTSLGIVSYTLADYPLAFADTIQASLPSTKALLQWATVR